MKRAGYFQGPSSAIWLSQVLKKKGVPKLASMKFTDDYSDRQKIKRVKEPWRSRKGGGYWKKGKGGGDFNNAWCVGNTYDECDIMKKNWNPTLRNELVPSFINTTDNKSFEWEVNWPKDNGCQSSSHDHTLKIGEKIDRFGEDYGYFFAPVGIPFEERAIPNDCNHPELRYRVFEVLKEFTVKRCSISPHFGDRGGGVQYQTGLSIKDNVTGTFKTIWGKNVGELLDGGFIKEVKPTPNRPC